MKKTNFTNSHLSGGAKAIRRLGFVAVCLAMASFFGMTQANAQTVDQVDEQTIEDVRRIFQEEEWDLEMEIKNPSGGVDTESNELLIKYYQSSINAWIKDGAEFKQSFIDHLYIISSGSNGGSADFSSSLNATYGEPIIEGAEGKQVRNLINQVNLEDNNNQDIQNIFDYLRTLKNS